MPSVDNRVVEMRFDNKDFQKGVTETIGAIDKLKGALKFDNIEEGLGAVEKAVSSISFDGITDGIQTIASRFSAFGVMGMRVLSNLADSAFDLGKKLVMAIPDQIIHGGWNRAMNIEKAKFQLEGLGSSWDELSKHIDYGVKDTAYGLDAAATVAAQLVASNVKFTAGIDPAIDGLDDMAKALRGISGVAAMTNSTYEDIGHLFTTAAGMGKVTNDIFDSLAIRGLNARAVYAKQMGIIGDATASAEQKVRDMASKGEISFAKFAEVMNAAFGDQAKKANETFNGAFDNMKAALSRIGQDFSTPIIQNSIKIFNALRETFNGVRNITKPFGEGKFATNFGKIADMIAYKISKFDATKLQPFIVATGNLSEALVNLMNGISPIADKFKEVWASMFPFEVGSLITDFSKKILSFSRIFETAFDTSKDVTFFDVDENGVTFTESNLSRIESLAYSVFKPVSLVRDALLNLWDAFSPFVQSNLNSVYSFISSFNGSFSDKDGERFLLFQDALSGIGNILRVVGSAIQDIINIIAPAANVINPLIDGVLGFFASFKEISNPMEEFIPDLHHMGYSFEEIDEILKNNQGNLENLKSIWSGIVSVFHLVSQAVSAAFDAISPLFSKLQPFADRVLSVGGSFGDWITEIDKAAEETDFFGQVFDGIVTFVTGIWDILKNTWDKISEFFSKAYETISPTIESIREAFSGLFEGIKSAVGFNPDFSGIRGFFEWLLSLIDVEKVLEIIGNLLGLVGDVIAKMIEAIGSALGDSKGGLKEFRQTIRDGSFTALFSTIGISFANVIASIGGIAAQINGALGGLVANLDADILWKVAKSVGALALSLWLISTIDEKDLGRSIFAVATLASILGAMLKVVDMITAKTNSGWNDKDGGIMGIFRNITNVFTSKVASRMGLGMVSNLLYSIAAAIVAFAVSVKILSTVPNLWESVAALGAIALIVAGMMYVMQKISEGHGILQMGLFKKFETGNPTGGLLKFVIALLLVIAALKSVQKAIDKNPDSFALALLSIITIMGALAGVMWAMQAIGNNKKLLAGDPSKGILAFAASVLIISIAVDKIASAFSGDPKATGLALASVGGIILALVGAMWAMQAIGNAKSIFAGNAAQGILSFAASVLIISIAVKKIQRAFSDDPKSTLYALIAIGGIIAALVTSMLLLKNVGGLRSMGVGAGMILMATGILILSAALRVLSALSFDQLITGLGAIAGALLVLGLAAGIFAPVIGPILALSAAFALLGVGAIGLGAGLMLLLAGLSMFAAGAGVFANAFVNLLTTIFEGIASVGGVIANAIVSVLTPLTNAFGTTILPALGNLVTTAFTSLLLLLGELFDGSGQILVNDILILINDVCAGLINAMPNIMRALNGLLATIMFGVAELLMSQAGWLIQIADKIFGTDIYGTLRGMLDAGEDAVIADLEASTAELRARNDELKGVAEETETAAESVVNARAELEANKNGLFTDTGTGGGAAYDEYLSSVAADTENASINLGNMFGSLTSTIDTGTSDLSESFGSFEEVLGDGTLMLDGLPDTTNESGLNFGLGFGGGVENSMDSVLSSVSALGTGSTDTLNEVLGIQSPSTVAEQSGAYFDEGLGLGISKWSWLVTAASIKVANGAVKALSNIGYRSYTYGYWFDKGLANGIYAYRYLVNAKVQEMANSALNTLATTMDSHSPSKETERFGKYFDQGFALGVGKNTNLIDGAVDEAGSNALSGIKSVVSRIIDAINGDFDTSMTITPVLDLSNIQNGAYRIGEMLNQNNSYGLGIANMAARTMSNNAADQVTANPTQSNAVTNNFYVQRMDEGMVDYFVNRINNELGARA